jgi:hypothetical protein
LTYRLEQSSDNGCHHTTYDRQLSGAAFRLCAILAAGRGLDWRSPSLFLRFDLHSLA